MKRILGVMLVCFCLLVSCEQAVEEVTQQDFPPEEEAPVTQPQIQILPVLDKDMRLVIDPQGHSAKIQDVMFTPDGRILVSVSNDKTIRLWNTETGDLIKTIRGQIGEGPEGKLYAGALSPDGKLLAVGGFLGKFEGDTEHHLEGLQKLARFEFHVGQIRLFDLESGEQVASLKGHTNVILDLTFSLDGKWLASGSADNMVRIWDISRIENPTLIGILEGHSDQVYGVAFSPDKSKLVSASYDGTLRLWKLPKALSLAKSIEGIKYRSMKRHAGEVRCVAYAPNGKYIVSGGKDNKILLWNTNGKFLKEIDEYSGPVATVNFSSDSTKIIAAGMGNFVPIVYVIPSGKKIARFTAHTNSIVASAFYGEQWIATGGDDHAIYLWNANTGARKPHIASKGKKVWTVAFGDRFRVAFGNSDYSPLNFDELPQNHPEYFPLEKSFNFQEMSLNRSLPVNNKFRRVQTIYQDKTLEKVSDDELYITNGGTIRNERSYDGRIRSYTFTSDGDVVVGSSFSLKLYNIHGELLRKFVGHTGEVFSVSVSEDGRILASASSDQTLRLWDLATGECLTTLFVSSDDEWICWIPQGYYAASAEGEQYIGWHLNQGMDNAAKYYPASAFRKLFYRPEIVKRTVILGNFERALAEFKKKLPAPPKEHHIAQTLPPVIQWLSPQALMTTTSHPTYRIHAKVRSEMDNKISDIKVLVNGRVQAVDHELFYSGRESLYSKEFEYEITLPEVRNTIKIVAATEHTEVVSEARVLNFITDKSQPAPEKSSEAEAATTDQYDFRKTRLALVIGNTSYLYGGSLPNPLNDASAMERTLRRLGFKVMRHENASQKEMRQAIDVFGQKLRGYDVGLFYYSGHGVQVDGENYLIPVDASLRSQHDVEYHCVKAGRVLSNMEFAKNTTNIVILDACRDNPFERSWAKSAAGRGLAFMNAPSGSLIAYATAPGKTAFDDAHSQNSIYTSALLNHIETPAITILDMFQRVRLAVMQKTENEQVPWESTSLTGDFYFSPGSFQPPTSPDLPPAPSGSLLRFDRIVVKNARGKTMTPVDNIYKVKHGEALLITVTFTPYPHQNVEIAWTTGRGKLLSATGVAINMYTATQRGGDYVTIHIWDTQTGDALSQTINFMIK